MSATHANTEQTRPENRYENNEQAYHFANTTDVAVKCDLETFHVNHIESLGIMAGLVYVNGVPITPNGTVHIPASSVVHRPKEGDNGVIEIESEYPIE